MYNFDKKYEWMLSKMNNEYIKCSAKKTEPEVYEFDIWVAGEADKSIARYRTKTAGQLAKKIVRLVKKLNSSK